MDNSDHYPPHNHQNQHHHDGDYHDQNNRYDDDNHQQYHNNQQNGQFNNQQHDHNQHYQDGFAVERVEHHQAQNDHDGIHQINGNAGHAHSQHNEVAHELLDDAEMNLPEEQSQEERENADNFNRLREQQKTPGVGFMRKLNASAYGKKYSGVQSKIDQLFDTLDEKAQLHNEFKSLAHYERKANQIEPVVQNIDAHPIILLRWNPHSSRFELQDEAIEALLSNNLRKTSKVSFVSIVGPRQSGKTFLLNQLLETTQNSSKFLSSEQYTNSLVMWSQPIYDPTTDTEVYFLDVQCDWEDSNPLKDKLFFFQCIISTVMIYNVRSNNLKSQDFSELRSLLHMQNHFEFDRLELKEDLKYLMPKLHVVMRDFTHEINRQGHTVSGNQLLEEFLFDDSNTRGQQSESELKIRRRLIKYLTDRDLTTMVCPIQGSAEQNNNINVSSINRSKLNSGNTEQIRNKLANLNWVHQDEIDNLFKVEIQQLRKRIIGKSDVRSIRGLRFSKNMVVQYIQSFLEDSNENEKFDFEKAISILLENEFITVYHECIDLYKNEMNRYFGNAEFMSLQKMNESLKSAREKVYYNFFQLKAHDIDQAEQLFLKYQDLLKKFLFDMEYQFIKINNEETLRVVEEMISQKLEIVKEKTCNGYFRNEDILFIQSEFESILEQVKHMSIGDSSQYGETYGVFVKSIQKMLMNSILKEIGKARTSYTEELDQLKKEKEVLKKQLDAAIIDTNNQKKLNEQAAEKKEEAANEVNKTQKLEKEVSANLSRHKADIENIKWLTSRYQKAESDKTC